MTVPPPFEIFKLGKIAESNPVASLLMKYIYSILSLKVKWEMQVVELFEFDYFFDRLARARMSGSKVHAQPNEQNAGSLGVSG